MKWESLNNWMVEIEKRISKRQKPTSRDLHRNDYLNNGDLETWNLRRKNCTI